MVLEYHITVPLGSKKFPGLVALVDAEDADRVLQHRWCPKVNRSGSIYAQSGSGSSSRSPTYLHRFVLDLSSGDLSVDHINGDGLDNRRSNLRICNQSQNLANQRKRKNSTSRYKGVSWHTRGKKWAAGIMVDGKQLHLGNYDSEMEAAFAYDAAARQHFGDFARPNFPFCLTYSESLHPLSDREDRLDQEAQKFAWGER